MFFFYTYKNIAICPNHSMDYFNRTANAGAQTLLPAHTRKG